MKKLFVFIISLLLLSFSLKLKTAGIISLVKLNFDSQSFINLLKTTLECFDLIIWLIFITISLPFKVSKTSKVICFLFGLIIAMGAIGNFSLDHTRALAISIFGAITLLVYFRIINKFNFAKKVKDNYALDLDSSKTTWQSALYTLVFSCVFMFSIFASISVIPLLIDAPIWTILVILPLTELLVFGLLTVIFQSFGGYIIERLNVHPSIIRSLYIYAVLSTIIIVMFYFTILPGPFISDIGFFQGMANIGITLFAMRVFSVSILQFQNHISRPFQAALAKNHSEFKFDEVQYFIQNDRIERI
jgi:hypothetical protein